MVVIAATVFGDLAVLDTEDVDTGHLNRSAERRDAEEVAQVCAAHGGAGNDAVPLGDQVGDMPILIWKGGAEEANDRLVASEAVLHAGRIGMVDEGGVDDLVGNGLVTEAGVRRGGAPRDPAAAPADPGVHRP